MSYTPENGDVADALYRAQGVSAFSGDYPVDPIPTAAVGDSTTSVETTVSAGAVVFGGDPLSVGQQTVTHPDGPAPGGGPNGEDEARVDLVTVDSNGSAGSMTGTPAVPRDGDGNAVERRFPNVVQPVPPTPTPSDDVVVIAAVWVPAGVGSSSEMFNDWVIPREVPGGGLFDLDLIPGRDLQYVLDNAREGETLVGDRSQTVTLDQPLTCSTPDVTIRNIDWRLADGTATSDTDDMLTLAADGITVENATLDGNMANQTADADGITVTASDCAVRDVRASAVGGHVVNVNGATNTVTDTLVRDVRAGSCRKDALVVQGTNTTRTRAERITHVGSNQRGTVTVRNGPSTTLLSNIFGFDQQRIIEIEDFGPDADGSAQVRTVWMDTVIGDGVSQLVNADLSAGFNHGGFRLTRAGGSNYTTSSGDTALVLFNKCEAVRVSACLLSSAITGANTVYLGNTGRGRIDHCRIRNNATDHAGIRIINPEFVDADHNECRVLPADAISVATDSASSGTLGPVTATHNRFDNIGGAGVLFSEDNNGATLDKVLATGNVGRDVTGAIIDFADVSGQTIVNDNMG